MAGKDLDGAVESLVKDLVKQGDLAGQLVIVSSHDLFESSTGLGAPLTNQLRGKIVSELKRRDVRVLLPGSDEDANMILQGTWQTQGENLALDFKVMKLTAQGPEAVAGGFGKDPPVGHRSRSAEKKPRIICASHGPKTGVQGFGKKTGTQNLYGKVRGGRKNQRTPSGLSDYLSDMFRNAMAESQLFAPLDEKKALRGLSSETLRKRGTRGISKQKKKNETASLVAELADSEGVLKGKAWRQGRTVAANVEIYDMDDTMMTAASVDIPAKFYRSA